MKSPADRRTYIDQALKDADAVVAVHHHVAFGELIDLHRLASSRPPFRWRSVRSRFSPNSSGGWDAERKWTFCGKIKSAPGQGMFVTVDLILRLDGLGVKGRRQRVARSW